MRALIVSVLLVATGCTQGPVTPEELQSYVIDPDHGLKKSIEVNGFRVDVTYRPRDLMVAQELRAIKDADTSVISKLRRQYEPYHYFVLSLSHNDKEVLNQLGDRQLYSDMLQRLAFQMRDYTAMTIGGDTLDVSDYQMDRTYGQSASNNILFAFPKAGAISNSDIRFHLKEFGLGIGTQVFVFNPSDIEAAPNVEFTW